MAVSCVARTLWHRSHEGSTSGESAGVSQRELAGNGILHYWRMWKWRSARSKPGEQWQARKALVKELESRPEPEYGYGPHWEAVIAGRREFTGKVLSGPYVGHDLLVTVHGEAALNREYEPADFSYSADYWLVDEDNAGPGDDEPDPSFDTLEELLDWLDGTPIEWHSPYVSLARIGRLSGNDGKQVP